MKNFLLDDLRVANKADSVSRMMDRHFTVDPDAQMLVASFTFEPKKESHPAVRDRKRCLVKILILFLIVSGRTIGKSLFLH